MTYHSRLEAALEYYDMGLSVIPCRPGQKTPAISSWKEYQEHRASREQIQEWWGKNPDYNIAVVTGEISGVSVVDLDGEEGERSASDLSLPPTREHKSPHGRHLVYLYNQDLHTGAKFLPGIDVRSDGGYCLFPPSMVDGQTYQVQGDFDIEELDIAPDALISRVVESTNGHHQEYEGFLGLFEGVSEGGRNDQATSYAGYLFSKGMAEDYIRSALLAFARQCTPPMEEEEIERIIASVGRYHEGLKPDNSIPGCTIFHWPESGVKFILENLRKTTDGLKCHIQVQDSLGDTLLAPVSVDLLSMGSRSQLARTLHDKAQAIGWDIAIEQIAIQVLGFVKEEEPTVDLLDYLESDIPKFILEPLILGDGATILFGQGGLGKSIIAMSAMLTATSGLDVLARTKRNRPAVGLYLDWEDTKEAQGERFNLLLKGSELTAKEAGSFHYRKMSAPLHDQITSLKAEIMEKGIDFLVIDSAALACGTAPETSDSALNFFNALRQLERPSLIIAHQTKNQNQPYPFGSIFWHNSARSTWEIRGEGEDGAGQESINICLINRKSNRARMAKRLGYEFSFKDTGITIHAMTDKEVNQVFKGEGSRVWEKIYWALAEHGQMTVKSIAEATESKEDYITNVLNRDAKSDTPVFTKVNDRRPFLYGIKQK